ncbi:MAG: VOC family protein [Acidimicrobiales bacterium]
MDQLLAFWDLSGVPGAAALRTDICRDLGLDPLTNHIAFQAADVADLALRRQRLIAHGHDVLEIDHGWIHSIYTEDPDGIAVEFAVITRSLSPDDARSAHELLFAPDPPFSDDEPIITVHRADASA